MESAGTIMSYVLMSEKPANNSTLIPLGGGGDPASPPPLTSTWCCSTSTDVVVVPTTATAAAVTALESASPLEMVRRNWLRRKEAPGRRGDGIFLNTFSLMNDWNERGTE